MGPMTWISGSYHLMIDDLSVIFCETASSRKYAKVSEDELIVGIPIKILPKLADATKKLANLRIRAQSRYFR
jgi:uncharacterized protein (DUF169 family)